MFGCCLKINKQANKQTNTLCTAPPNPVLGCVCGSPGWNRAGRPVPSPPSSAVFGAHTWPRQQGWEAEIAACPCTVRGTRSGEAGGPRPVTGQGDTDKTASRHRAGRCTLNVSHPEARELSPGANAALELARASLALTHWSLIRNQHLALVSVSFIVGMAGTRWVRPGPGSGSGPRVLALLLLGEGCSAPARELGRAGQRRRDGRSAPAAQRLRWALDLRGSHWCQPRNGQGALPQHGSCPQL